MLLLLLLPGILAQSYISVPPVKLLTAKLFGDIFPAADSEFRIASTGEDHDIELSQLEEANQMPHQQLVLPPGGSAVYTLPIDKDLIYLMIRPGKKEGGTGSPYSDKADITVYAAADSGEPVSVECHVNSHDGSPAPDRYCTLDLQPLHEMGPISSVKVTILVPNEETRMAFIWQLHLSPLDDSERVMGTFEEDGRKRIRNTQEDEATNTWLTMVSIVGNTGVGKSTVASLLSGNDTMFKVASSSSGTTTIGADISPIIPSDDYGVRMEDILNLGPLHNPGKSRPLFLIDSEGMSFRGDEVDFVTTGPVAIIANIIVWITTDRMRPPEILEKVDEYMKGLDRITMGDESGDEQAYGEFIIVLNKMQLDQQGSTDEQICNELMAYGPDEGDNDIRTEMYMRFRDIACIGFPTVVLEEGEPFGYPVLERYPRFREGIKKLANRILKESETPLSVTVGPKTMEMNSTEAETIIGMLIDGANKGNIDLSDFCNVIGSITKEKIIQGMAKITTEMEEATQGLCNASQQLCAMCACQYKNDAVDLTVNSMNEVIINAIDEASLLCADKPDVQEDITDLMQDYIQPWASLNRCSGSITTTANPKTTTSTATTPNERTPTTENTTTNESTIPGSSPTATSTPNINTTTNPAPRPIPRQCDISAMDLNYPGQEVDIICINLFLCGTSFIDAQRINISVNMIYVASNTTIETVDLGQAQKGSNATGYGLEGGKGEDGAAAANLTIHASKKLTSSADSLIFTSRGQKGGQGGNGGEGQPMNDTCYGGPSSPQQVVSMGEQYNYRHETHSHCSITTCHTHNDYWYYKYNLTIPEDCCGGDGGKAGDGGDGGAPGILAILGDSGVYPISNRIPGPGGNPGTRGTGSAGYRVERIYLSWYSKWTSTECGWGSDWFHCEYWNHDGYGGYGINPNNDKLCLGNPGPPGNPGKPWEDTI